MAPDGSPSGGGPETIPALEDPVTDVHADGTPRLVDWRRTARRLRTTVTVLAAGALAGWLVSGLVAGGPEVSRLGAWLGGAVGLLFLAEIVIVGGSALRGMLRAGERGERLADGDVGLLPPQLSPRGRSRRGAGAGGTPTATDPDEPEDTP